MQNKILRYISKINFNIVSRSFLFWLQSFQRVLLKRPKKKCVEKIKIWYLIMQNFMPSAKLRKNCKKSTKNMYTP